MDVAISRLRGHLKEYLDRARAGERVVVTDRGVPVARLVPVDAEGVLDRLEREGALTRARSARRPVASKKRRVKARGPVVDLLLANRRDRDDGLLR